MPNIATVLKQEITRLAAKEVKARTAVTRKASSQHRRDIAELKRQVKDLTGQVAYLAGVERKRVKTSPASSDAAEGRRFSSQRLVSHREKLGISAADYAALVGVSGQTVYNWEQGRSRPGERQLAALVGVRGISRREALKRLDIIES